jgi:hypothetical protein
MSIWNCLETLKELPYLDILICTSRKEFIFDCYNTVDLRIMGIKDRVVSGVFIIIGDFILLLSFAGEA